MRIRIAAGTLLTVFLPAAGAAQQGSLQVTGAAQSVQGDSRRTFGQPELEPDVGVSWLQPGTRLGIFQLELRGTQRDGTAHLGRALISARDFKYRGALLTVQAGDSYFSPAIGDYRFANLPTPSVTFAGASISARTSRSSLGLIAGRATATRNFFGTDPDTLDQTLALARGSFKASDRLELFTRASHVGSGDLGAYGSTIARSDQGGAAARWIPSPALHVIGDAAVVSYRRHEDTASHLDGSGLIGASVLLARGWLQVNAARFSPGELPLVNQSLTDRRAVFAAGEFDAFARLRLFGGWETFRTNLDPGVIGPTRSPTSDGTRGFGGFRSPIGTRSSVAVRLERGDRRSRLSDDEEQAYSSDTGVLTAEWQAGFGGLTSVARYSRRQNVESRSLAGSHTVDDTSGHLFVSLSQALQVFGNASATRTSARDRGGSTFWQLGGGGQAQMLHRSLWLRAEGSISRNADRLTAWTFPQHSLNVGLNGEIAPNTILGVNVNVDRLATPSDGSASWVTRSSVRLTRTFQTGTPRIPTSVAGTMARHGGTGSISGAVFTDWNADGRPDAGEEWLENIPVRLTNLGSATTSERGEFAFINVPIGLQEVGIDLSVLPVDFDQPAIPQVQLQLGRGETKRVLFGLVPFGAIAGRVVLDVNANSVADAGERAVDGAVVVLDGGARSEKARKGEFRFQAVRSGDHTLALLPESLPAGMSPSGPAQVELALTRESANADVVFLVTERQRPELRKTFDPGGRTPPPAAKAPVNEAPRASGPAPGVARPATRTASTARTASPVLPPRPASAGSIDGFAVQVIALNDPSRARARVDGLKASGFPAYLVEPPSSDPDAPYRVRVGRYATEEEARAVATSLRKTGHETLWVVRER